MFINFNRITINTNEILYFDCNEIFFKNGERLTITYSQYEQLLNLLGCDNSD